MEPETAPATGSVTVLAARKEYPVYVDETVILFDVIAISAGVRGTQVLIAPESHLRTTGRAAGEIAREKERII